MNSKIGLSLYLINLPLSQVIQSKYNLVHNMGKFIPIFTSYLYCIHKFVQHFPPIQFPANPILGSTPLHITLPRLPLLPALLVYFLLIDWQKKKIYILCWRIPIELISNFLHNNIFWIICFHIDLFLICACSHLIRYMILLQFVYIPFRTPTTFFQTSHWIYFLTHGSYISNDWF
jgi:hypothetical protein